MSKYGPTYIPQPLAFYRELTSGDRRYQSRNLNQCSGGTTWRLTIVGDFDDPQFQFPRFDLKMNYESSGVTDFFLRSVDGVTNVSLNTSYFSVASLGLDSEDVEWWAITFSGTPIDSALDSIPEKEFYLTVEDGANVWYSETFWFADESTENSSFPESCGSEGWLKISYSNSGCIISNTFYNDGPSFEVFIPADLAQPNYLYKPDPLDDGDGGTLYTFKRLDKRWEFYITAPEYMADALTAIQMFANVSLTFVGNDVIICRDVEVGVDWINACEAKIKFTFSAEFLAKTACC